VASRFIQAGAASRRARKERLILVFHQVPLSEKRAGLRAVHDALVPGGELHVADYGQPPSRDRDS
jgi:hypothetical protein